MKIPQYVFQCRVTKPAIRNRRDLTRSLWDTVIGSAQIQEPAEKCKMAKNHKFYFDDNGVPCARGPHTEKLLMSFLETDVQGDDSICHDLMEDIRAVESEAAEEREFTGNAHTATISKEGIHITCHAADDDSDNSNDGDKAVSESEYTTTLRHFREVVEDWEAFILDEAEI